MSAPAMPRRRGPRRGLTEDEILDAALGLLGDGGPHAASVRGIAARVGVAPNAVYTYFPDKAAVIEALVERLLGEVDHDVFADRTRPWRERVESLAPDLRSHLSAQSRRIRTDDRRADGRSPRPRARRTTPAADTMAGYISTEQYLWGLRRVLDGIAVRRPRLVEETGPQHVGRDADDGSR
jgi:AcrR family transcriptional regulator